MQLGSIPTSCHPKPRLSTPQDLVEFTFILCQKEESPQNGKKVKISLHIYSSVKNSKLQMGKKFFSYERSTTLKTQKKILPQNWIGTISSLLY